MSIYDAFICHASEDKVEVVLPLAYELIRNGLRVWLDTTELTVGDSLRGAIDAGLVQSRFGIVVLSPKFFAKRWPQKELDGLFSKEANQGKVILPVWHNITHDGISAASPLLAGRIGVSTLQGIPIVASQLLRAIRKEGVVGLPDPLPLDVQIGPDLSGLSASLLTSSSARELRRASYEAEDLLAKYPTHVDLRLLKDDLDNAYRHESTKSSSAGRSEWRDMASSAPSGSYSSGSSVGCGPILAGIAVLGLIGYFAWRLIAWIITLFG